jgi:hypothetical protein
VREGKVRDATMKQIYSAFVKGEQQSPPKGEGRKAAGQHEHSSPSTFFAVHCEAGTQGPPLKWQEAHWPALVRFNPQWAEYILKDAQRLQRVKGWQNNGHEIALHYHMVRHGDWCGYTNREEWKRDPRYRGTV